MDPAAEQKVLQSFYDRIYQMLIYTPAGGNPAFPEGNTLVLLARDNPIDPADYKNAVSLTNPNGSLTAAEMLFGLTDHVQAFGTDFGLTGTSVARTYETIVNGANVAAVDDPTAVKDVAAANAFLFSDPAKKVMSVSYKKYLKNKAAYQAATTAYATAYYSLDLTKPKDQREWQVQAKGLQGAVDDAWNTWVAEGKDQVELNLDTLATRGNNATQSAFANAKSSLKEMSQASNTPGDPSWYLTTAFPSDWYDPSVEKNFTLFKLDSDSAYTSTSSYYGSYGASMKESLLGLVSWGASTDGSVKADSYHLETESLQITAKLQTVMLWRPWLDESLLRLAGWSNTAYPPGAISTGKMGAAANPGAMPLMVTGFVVATDVSITANWSTKDTSTITTHVAGGGGFKFGPFSVGSAKAGSDSSSSTASSTFDGGTLKFGGLQIVAVICEILPFCPPS